MKRIFQMVGAATFAALLPLSLHAAVSADEAARLGKDLTPSGGEMGANADGTIPAFTGKWLGAPPHVKYDGSYNPDPYADDKPLYSITSKNLNEYADKLSEGTKLLFARYPQTYRIDVYPTRRDFRLDDERIANIKLNATQAKLSNEGLTMTGAYGGVAFPMPKDGMEVIYNVFSSSAPYLIESPQISAYVFPNGSVSWSEVYLRVLSFFNKKGARNEWDGGIYSQSISEQRAPPRDAGKFTITANSFDFVKFPRQAWGYDPGTRRLRKTPDVGFDYPMDTGPRVVDEQNGYNGSPERFDWKLVGRKEMIVPFNNYKLEARNLKHKDMITTRGHPNPDHIRFELRRVWVVEGTLKPSLRHIYSKRRFYVEEDSWHKVVADQYDRRGQLWRVSMDGMVYAYDAKAYYNNVSWYHDLDERSYSIEKLNNELPNATLLNRREPRPNEFSLDGVRRGGR